MIEVSVITVSWNTREHLKESLETLFKSEGVSFEVCVVDNHSADGTVEMLRELQDTHEELVVIANGDNRGFAAANNQGMALARGRYILLLNPDMVVGSTTLQKMVAWMEENPRAGVAGCRLESPRGALVPHVRRFPTWFDQLMIVLKVPHLFPGVLNQYLLPDFDYDEAQAVDSVRGSFFMIRAQALKTSQLDERYFIWFEEVDFCKQVISKGWQVWYTPVVTVVDKVGQSFKQIARLRAQKWFLQSMIRYFRKWGV